MLSDGPGASAAGPSEGAAPEAAADSLSGAGGEDEAPSEELGLEDDDEEDGLLELPEDEPDDDGDEAGDEDFGEPALGEEVGDLLPPDDDDDCGGLPLGEPEEEEPLGEGLLLGEPDGEAAEAKPMRATKRREKTIMWRAISVKLCVQ